MQLLKFVVLTRCEYFFISIGVLIFCHEFTNYKPDNRNNWFIYNENSDLINSQKLIKTKTYQINL